MLSILEFIEENVVGGNACTLVPTVFRWHGEMEFKCHLHFLFSHDFEKQILFFVFASLWKTDMNLSFRFSFSHHFEKRIWILFFVFALLVIEKQIGVSFVMNLKSGLIHQSFETPPRLPKGMTGIMRGLSLHNHPIFIPRWARDTLEIPVFASLTGE